MIAYARGSSKCYRYSRNAVPHVEDKNTVTPRQRIVGRSTVQSIFEYSVVQPGPRVTTLFAFAFPGKKKS